MRIALIGGAGYVGTRLAQRLALVGGIEAIAVLRSYHGLSQLSRFGVPYRLGDASNLKSLAEAIEGCDAVVNLTMGNNGRILPDAKVIWEACRIKAVPLFIHLSSGAVHGRAAQPHLSDDSAPEHGLLDYYARAKARTETWLREQIGKGGPRIVALRPVLIWGPGSLWVTGPATALLAGNACLVDEGKGICNLIYIDNLMECIFAVARSEGKAEGIFNVSDKEETTWRKYYLSLAQAMGLEEPHLHYIKESDFHEPLANQIQVILEHPVAKKVKSVIPKDIKKGVKAWLGGLVAKPRPAERLIHPCPQMDYVTWWIQTTRRKLPTAKFNNAYGNDIAYISFEDAMARTAAWMQFAGFCVA